MRDIHPPEGPATAGTPRPSGSDPTARNSTAAWQRRSAVFPAMRLGLHLVILALAVLVIIRAILAPQSPPALTIPAVLGFLAVYVSVPLLRRAGAPGRSAITVRIWLAVLTVVWVALVALQPDAAYIVFPLFFLYLHLLTPRSGVLTVIGSALLAICLLAWHDGWSVGGVVGPLIGACVALMIGLGFRALGAESSAREALMAELMATRDQLAASEHEAGVLAERARLAREIHDTVAQGLSSVQMLLHAAERADPDGPGVDHLRLARETAAADLADTRRFIRELSTPRLDDHGLAGALRRLAATDWASGGLRVDVRVGDDLTLPMHQQTALLRICQGAIANVLQHAGATRARIDLRADARTLRLTIADDGAGFDPDALTPGSGDPWAGDVAPAAGRTDSFGLRAIRERVAQLGGTLDLRSAAGEGTTLVIDLARTDTREQT
ncbi:MAG: sensor histidine kinase [Brachybacterium sp.]|nr:sensor histidine kinase [Brachybacterium sp.]